ncbi:MULTISPECIES: anthranilate phosphoribosyltransferase [unclassified Leptotrichia]|uniref:anthranilate phosphoribosyltransferase n=1 Tax=unclassified Leptotrichia TaxID=2633022 RepID=UPI0003AE12AB|nr:MULTISPECIES: anthranilate phosphoribosyltransferase [unclassified Leptotrichia]ERL24974.1 anthranilate phosphoribosyltransferase [Leptotrichia sp. oral taxon 225 str. F0581]WLD73455.1 anthranilate phosphoribosyltransferase [Leptotrichia sp. HMT-225]
MILMIDNYDSFVFNVEQYLKEMTDDEVITVRNDAITIDDIKKMNPSKIIFSPGPKHPKDSGICLEILNNTDELGNIPILGICLGHQAIGMNFGGEIKRLENPLHGKTSEITVLSENSVLFKNLPKKFKVMRYHSLYVDDIPEDLEVTAKSEDGVAMAVEHKSKNIFGIQFHPESIFTEYGKNMIRNFLNIEVSETLQNDENSKNTNEKGNFIDMNKYLKKLQENIALTDTDFREICKIIDSKNYDIVQLGALLVLISEKSLYPESLTAFVKNILEYSTTFEDDSDMIDVCGTGGDGFKTINISTAVAFILGAMGVNVAKHGNRAISSKSGSSDVLDKLGVPLENSLANQIEKLHVKNLAFFHAPFFHKLVGEVREVRRRLGIRTVFNILGPLLHPNTKLKYQLVGLYHEPVHRLYAETLQLLGRKHALAVRGNDGLDEITICDDTKIIEVKDEQIFEYTVSPESFGFKRAFHSEIEGGTPEENAEILVKILKGEEKSAKFDIVVLNAMFALYTADVVDHPAKAKDMVLEAIESGKVYEFYKDYVKITK